MLKKIGLGCFEKFFFRDLQLERNRDIKCLPVYFILCEVF